MIALTIAPEFKAKIPAVVVGWITATVRNSQHDEALWREIEAAAARFRGVNMDEARKSPPIKALRDAYRALGQRSNPLPWLQRGPGAADLAGEGLVPGEYGRGREQPDLPGNAPFGGHVRPGSGATADNLPSWATG